VMSYHGLFAGTVGGFVASALMVRGTAIPVGDRAPGRQRWLVGMQIMLTDNGLRALIAMNLAVAAATGLVMVNTVVYVRDLLGGGEVAVAMMLAGYGAGSMVLALLVPRLLGACTEHAVMLAGAGIAAAGLLVTSATLAAAPNWAVLAGNWVALGAATSMVNTPAGRLLRRASTDTTRTAVYTAQFSLSHAGFLVTYPVAGWVGAAVDQGLAAAILAILDSFAALAAAWIVARGRGEGTDGQDVTPENADAGAKSRPRQLAGP
jgi:hypothetical protein